MRRRNLKRKQFMNRPLMVSQASSYGRSALHPAVVVCPDPDTNPEAIVVVAEIVETTDEVHGLVEGLRLPGEGSGTSGQGVESRTKGGIEAFDVGGIDDTRNALAGLTQP